MSKDYFDKLVSALEEKTIKRARKVYSTKVLAYWKHPANWGKLTSYNAHAQVRGKCGDMVELFLKIENKLIKDISFLTDGCIGSIACNAILTKMVKNKPLDKALNLTPKDIITALGGLPETERHCADLAIETFKKAII
jgi:nitrogen fixation NifU-like protein